MLRCNWFGLVMPHRPEFARCCNRLTSGAISGTLIISCRTGRTFELEGYWRASATVGQCSGVSFATRWNGSTLRKVEKEAINETQTLVWLIPDRTTILDALRALAYVGTKEDLPVKGVSDRREQRNRQPDIANRESNRAR